MKVALLAGSDLSHADNTGYRRVYIYTLQEKLSAVCICVRARFLFSRCIDEGNPCTLESTRERERERGMSDAPQIYFRQNSVRRMLLFEGEERVR